MITIPEPPAPPFPYLTPPLYVAGEPPPPPPVFAVPEAAVPNEPPHRGEFL